MSVQICVSGLNGGADSWTYCIGGENGTKCPSRRTFSNKGYVKLQIWVWNTFEKVY